MKKRMKKCILKIDSSFWIDKNFSLNSDPLKLAFYLSSVQLDFNDSYIFMQQNKLTMDSKLTIGCKLLSCLQ